MKKMRWKKIFMGFMLVFAMTIAFTACGEKAAISKNIQEREYIYQPSFQSIDVDVGYISNACMKDNNVYMFTTQWVENKKKGDGSGKEHQYFISCAMDGSNLQQTEIKGLKENEWVSVFVLDDQNQFRLVTQQYSYNEETDESSQKYYVHTLNEKGKITDTIELKRKKSENPDEDYFYLDSRGVVFFHGKVYAAIDTKIYSFDEKGKESKVYEMNGDSYIQNLIVSSDGKIYLYGSNNTDYGFQKFDPETGEFGKLIKLGDYRIYSLRDICPIEGNKISVNDGGSLYTVDLSSGKITEEFNWLNSDMDGDNVTGCFPIEDGKFFGITSSYDDNNQKSIIEFVTMNKIKASDVKKKEIIHFSCTYLDYELKNKILSFNKKNENYRIEVKEYDAYEEPAKQLNLDIISGNIPDMLDLSNAIPKDQMIKKDMFIDLYPLIEKDTEINKEDFIPSILKTLENDGKLYYLTPSFSVQALIAGKNIVGDIEGWTMDDMIKLYDSMPKDGVFMQYMTRQWFLQNIVSAQMNQYINWSSGEVKFDSDDFIKLIEFSNHFPDEEEEIDYENQESVLTLVNKGKLMLQRLYMYDVTQLGAYQELYKKQGGYKILSYPSEDKNNKLIMSLYDSALAITKQCKNPEGAWEFIRQFYTYDYQKTYTSCYTEFPIRNDVLNKKLEYAQATEAYTDEDGTEVTPIDSSIGYDEDFEIKVKPLNEEQVEEIRSIIDRVGICISYDTARNDIFEIINEEMKAFFAKDKSAKETAEVIQSRVKIYVSENS